MLWIVQAIAFAKECFRFMFQTFQTFFIICLSPLNQLLSSTPRVRESPVVNKPQKFQAYLRHYIIHPPPIANQPRIPKTSRTHDV